MYPLIYRQLLHSFAALTDNSAYCYDKPEKEEKYGQTHQRDPYPIRGRRPPLRRRNEARRKHERRRKEIQQRTTSQGLRKYLQDLEFKI